VPSVLLQIVIGALGAQEIRLVGELSSCDIQCELAAATIVVFITRRRELVVQRLE
jgi:hypothetical protein